MKEIVTILSKKAFFLKGKEHLREMLYIPTLNNNVNMRTHTKKILSKNRSSEQ